MYTQIILTYRILCTFNNLACRYPFVSFYITVRVKVSYIIYNVWIYPNFQTLFRPVVRQFFIRILCLVPVLFSLSLFLRFFLCFLCLSPWYEDAILWSLGHAFAAYRRASILLLVFFFHTSSSHHAT